MQLPPPHFSLFTFPLRGREPRPPDEQVDLGVPVSLVSRAQSACMTYRSSFELSPALLAFLLPPPA